MLCNVQTSVLLTLLQLKWDVGASGSQCSADEWIVLYKIQSTTFA